MWSLHLPSTSGVKTCSHSKAVRASFTIAWKNARAKAPHTAEESLVRPAAVKIARIMCSDAVAHGGVQPSSTTGPNAHNQIGPWTTVACVKLCGLDKSLTAYWRLAILLTCVLCVFVWLNRHCFTRCGQHSVLGSVRVAVGHWAW